MKGRKLIVFVAIALGAMASVGLSGVARNEVAGQQASAFEVWVADQGNVGPAEAGRLYIYPGTTVDGRSQIGDPQIIEFGTAAQCVGDGVGRRPHFIEINRSHTHGVIANVASGHVYVIRGADHAVVASIDVGLQAHHAVPTADGSAILVAKQNDKRLGRIRADFTTDTYTYNPAEDIDLGALQDAGHPDNAPICPVLVGSKAYVTLRGGGLYIVDTVTMQITKSFTNAQIAPAGCGGVVIGDKVYVNSGTATSSSLYVFDATNDTLLKTITFNPGFGTDAHGMMVLAGRYVWMANRGNGDNIVVLDATTDTIIRVVSGFGAAPDLMVPSPAGDLVFLTLRGPNALTGGPSARGMTPGLAVLQVLQGGVAGQFASFSPIGSQASDSPNDPHGIGLRRVSP
jgi:DNA-binding beta-propeller fold protein YncE